MMSGSTVTLPDTIIDLNRCLRAICSPIPNTVDRAFMADTHPGPCHVFCAHSRSQLSEFLDTNDRFSEFADGKACWVVS